MTREKSGDVRPAAVLRGFLFWRKENERSYRRGRGEETQEDVWADGKAGASSRTPKKDLSREESAGEREDEEVAFAGDDDGEGAAVGGDGEIAEGETVKDGNGLRLRDGNVMSR